MESLEPAGDAIRAVLTGMTFDGRAITGSAPVRIVQQKGPPPPPLPSPVLWNGNGIDGAMAASQGTSSGWGTDNTEGSFRVATTWDGSFATDRYSVDNIKVWDFAKTDFSDRFTE